MWPTPESLILTIPVPCVFFLGGMEELCAGVDPAGNLHFKAAKSGAPAICLCHQVGQLVAPKKDLWHL